MRRVIAVFALVLAGTLLAQLTGWREAQTAADPWPMTEAVAHRQQA